MNVTKFLDLMGEYGVCPDCGNDLIGNGEGELYVTDTTFIRTCKCGFSVEICEEGEA